MGDTDDILQFKCIFLGDQGVGKSSVLTRFCQDKFSDAYQSTVGLDFQTKIMDFNGTSIKLLVYDTAGQEKFRSLIPMYIREAKVIILVYDITTESTFNNASYWVNETSDLKKEDVIFVLVGNKIDLTDRRAVQKETGEKYAEENNFLFYEVSAKTGEGVNELFKQVILPEMGKKFDIKESEGNIEKIIIDEGEMQKNEKKKGGCCGGGKKKKAKQKNENKTPKPSELENPRDSKDEPEKNPKNNIEEMVN